MILHNTKPDLIIEIGTHQGGSALYLADLMYLYNKKSEVHTIDIYASVTEPLVINNPRIKLFTKGWENYPIESAKNFKRVMVIDDGSHRSEDVFQALIKFAPLVNPGLYYIVEDGIVTSLGIESELQLNGGPIVGIQKFNRLHSSFLRDLSIEEFWGRGATANQYGYLLKR
jgi:cephalosporin hydroxylase